MSFGQFGSRHTQTRLLCFCGAVKSAACSHLNSSCIKINKFNGNRIFNWTKEMIILSSLPIMLQCNPATLWCEQLQRARRRSREMFSRCRAGLWCLLKMISPQLPGSGYPAMTLGGGKVKAQVGNCLCPHTQLSHCTTTAKCTQLFEGKKKQDYCKNTALCISDCFIHSSLPVFCCGYNKCW